MGIASLISSSLAAKNALEQRRLEIMEQDARNRGLVNVAEANLTNTRAGLMPAESKAGVTRDYSLAELHRASARNTDEQTRYVGPLARAEIGVKGAMGANYLANAGESNARSYQITTPYGAGGFVNPFTGGSPRPLFRVGDIVPERRERATSNGLPDYFQFRTLGGGL